VKDLAPRCRFYFAGSSEMFGKAEELPQTENTRFHPRSSYGISKVCGFELTRNYREAYGLHASSGILFNHESPRRGFEFVTRKITSGVARILAGRSKQIQLGNLEAKRDWGHAREYVQAMWLMLQQPEPDDYVVATGETHSVREFVELAFSQAGLDYRDHVTTDPTLFRPAEVNLLLGDATKARTSWDGRRASPSSRWSAKWWMRIAARWGRARVCPGVKRCGTRKVSGSICNGKAPSYSIGPESQSCGKFGKKCSGRIGRVKGARSNRRRPDEPPAMELAGACGPRSRR
jgi:nucleoside-diphosphate-sugar epimerase